MPGLCPGMCGEAQGCTKGVQELWVFKVGWEVPRSLIDCKLQSVERAASGIDSGVRACRDSAGAAGELLIVLCP